MRRLLVAVAALALALTGCTAPQSFDGYVSANCDPTTADGVTACRVTQKPVPTVTATAAPAPTVTVTVPGPTVTATQTVTATATPTATTSPDGVTAAAKYNWGAVLRGDEFNYVGPPDPKKWGLYNGAGHAGNGKRVPGAWAVDGNVVRVTGDAAGNTGGMAGLYNWGTQYLRMETRMRTNDRDPEYHPVLILWPDAGWTSSSCPEIDYAEGTGNPAKIHFYLHTNDCAYVPSTSREIDTTQWHNYAVEWSPNGVFGWIDGELWFSNTSTAAKTMSKPMHDTIQLDWFPQDSAAANPKVSWMEVDWTRTYARP